MVKYFIGVDGGGSKTSAVVVNERLELIGEGRSGPSNHLRVGLAEATANVERAVVAALQQGSISSSEIEYVYCGIAGSDHPRHREKMVESLGSLFPKNNFTVDSDARIALTAGIGTGPGIVVIAGTGSVAFGRNEAGEEARAGGWGPMLGDEGSGYSIARQGLAAVVRAFDGRGPKTLITELLCTHHGMCDPVDLPYFVYAASTQADDIARHGKIVFDAALAGDPVARGILQKEGTELGVMVAAVARNLRMLDLPFPVAYVGGAFNSGSLLVDPLMSELHRHAPHATIHPAEEIPAMGAARMAITASANPRPSRSPR